MERDGGLKLVRTLTRSVVELFCPGKVDSFEEDFAVFALTAGVPQVSEKTQSVRLPGQSLDTTLVAGMFFQVLMQAKTLPAGPSERVSFVRKEAKNFLVNRLAGQITLSQFYRLLNLIEEDVRQYFESLGSDWTGLGAGAKEEPALAHPLPEPIKAEELRRALSKLALPLKGRRKLTPEGLWAFLRDTEGGWFRLLDLEGHFRVNKKTAWGYLNLLLKAGILQHNGEKANRVRYALAATFRAAGSLLESEYPPRPGTLPRS
jgi:hypothetical protein